MNMIKKNLKKWIALVMAVVMVMTSGIISTNQTFRAAEEDGTTEVANGNPTGEQSEGEVAAPVEEIVVEDTTTPVESEPEPVVEETTVPPVVEATAMPTVEATPVPTTEATIAAEQSVEQPEAIATPMATPIVKYAVNFTVTEVGTADIYYNQTLVTEPLNVESGKSVTFNVVAKEGYEVETVEANGFVLSTDPDTTNQYSIYDVRDIKNIKVTTKALPEETDELELETSAEPTETPETIEEAEPTATPEETAKTFAVTYQTDEFIAVEGATTVNADETLSITVVPMEGYEIAEVTTTSGSVHTDFTKKNAAKTYTVTGIDADTVIEATSTIETFNVTYNVTPTAGATVSGEKKVTSGDELSFEVLPTDGYELTSVIVNGTELNSSSEEGAATKAYTLESVTADTTVEITLNETVEHPAFEQSVTVEDGTTITVSAKQGVLPAGTQLSATLISSNLEGSEEGEEIVKSVSYDVTLLTAEGNKLSNENWTGFVSVNFAGPVIAEVSTEADTVKILHTDDAGNTSTEANVAVSQETAISEVGCTTTHFSIFQIESSTAASSRGIVNTDGTALPSTLKVGESITIYTTVEKNTKNNHKFGTWETNKNAVELTSSKVKVNGYYYSQVTIKAVAASSDVTVKYTNGDTTDSYTFNIESENTWKAFNCTPTIQNAQVMYIAYHDANGASSNGFQMVNGNFTVDEYVSNNENGYIVFFVKPNENYIVTGLGASGNGDIYALAASNYGNIENYPGIHALAEVAKAQGYVAAFGYSRAKGTTENVNAAFTLYGAQPGLQVTATSNKQNGVQIGDQITFTVSIRPDTTLNGKTLSVSDLSITNLQINGQSIDSSAISQNSDGNYIVNYVATQADVDNGAVVLNVSAKADYSYGLGVSNGTVTTTSEISNSANTTCNLDEQINLFYTYQFLDQNGVAVTKPSDVSFPTLPETKRVYAGEQIEIATIYQNQVSATGGNWVFDGWYNGTQKVEPGSTFTMGNTSVGLIGKWKFTPRNVTLTFHNSSNGTVIKAVKGSYGTEFATGKSVEIDLEAAKVYVKNGNYGILAQTVDAADSLNDLKDLGFTFTFDGWCTGAHNGGTMVVYGSDMSTLAITYKNNLYTGLDTYFGGETADVYAHYSIEYSQSNVTISFDGNAENVTNVPQSISGIAGKQIAEKFPDNEPLREGYRFTGWNTQADGNGTAVTSYPSTYVNATYFAQWTKLYSVTYAWKGESPLGNERLPIDTNEYAINEIYSVSNATFEEIDTKDDFENVTGTWKFDGWDVPENQKMVENGVTITGSWTYTPNADYKKYNVTYAWKGESPLGNERLPIDTNEYAISESYPVSNVTFEAIETKDDFGNVTGTWVFDGWKVPENQKMVENGVTITGTWTFKPSVSNTEYLEVSNPEDTPYNGKEQIQPVTVTDKKTNKPLVEGTDYEITYTPAINAGKVTVTITGKGDYVGSITKEYFITPVSVIVTAVPDSKHIDSYKGIDDPEFSAKVTGLVNDEPETLISYTVSRNAGETAGKYTITPTGDEVQGNYTVTYVPAEFTITTKVVIHYVYASDNSTAFEDREVVLNEENNYTYNVPSPTKTGFTTRGADFVANTVEKPQKEYLEITVLYYPVVVPVVPTDPGVDPIPDPIPDPVPPAPEPVPAVVVPGGGIILPPVDNAPDGQGAEIEVNEDGTVDVVAIEDTETPLSNFTTVHRCNVLPFLFTLLALLVLILFTHDAKKRQKHIQELKEELELRKLGIDPKTLEAVQPTGEVSTETSPAQAE